MRPLGFTSPQSARDQSSTAHWRITQPCFGSGLPTWATLSTSGLRAVILPPEVETVIIAADADEAGEVAAQAAARRFIAEGRKVKIARPPKGMDFNDLLLKPENVVPFSTVMEAAHD